MGLLTFLTLVVIALLAAPARASDPPTCAEIRKMTATERDAAARAYGLTAAERAAIKRLCRVRS